MELTISRYTAHLNALSTTGTSQVGETADLEEKKRQLVKRICDLKVKLAKLREEEEFEDALKEQQSDDTKGDLSGKLLLVSTI